MAPREPPGGNPMIPFHTRLFGAVVALTLAASSPALSQQLELKIMAPAAPGGGWDQTARSMQQALVAAKIARSVQVTNVAAAGGVDHVMAALFAGTIGADAKKVNYIPFSGGGESLAAILGGKVTAGISGLSEYDGQIKSGKLRALGVTSEKRIAGVDIPTFK